MVVLCVGTARESDVEERHEHEQYFFDAPTLTRLAELLSSFRRPCLLCAPMLGKHLVELGRAPVILDIDDRFRDVSGYQEFNLHRPKDFKVSDGGFDVIFCDPPFFGVKLSALFRAIRVLARYDFKQRVAVSYLTRRAANLCGTFVPFGLEPTDTFLTYVTVQPDIRNKVQLFANWVQHV